MFKVGIVGAGSMGTTHAAAWKNTPAHITGIFALNTDRAQQLAASVNTRVYDSFDSLLADVDVIDICTPTYLHHDQVIQAAQMGKQVICEKPLARTYAQGQAMINACQQAGVHLLVAQVVRFFPEYAGAKQVVERGDIGSVAVMRLTRCSYQPQMAQDNWFLDFDKSGGMILDLMIHDFDYARWIAGEVESVYVRSVLSRNPNAGTDYCIAILKHTNGAISNIEGGWAYPPPMFRTSLEIAGDNGLIEHPAGESQPLQVFLKQTASGASEVALPRSPLLEDPYTTEIKHFYEVLTGSITTPRVTAHDGLAALRIGLAALDSARTGQPVNVSEVQ